MAVFRKLKDLNIKYSYQDPQKAHPWSERRLLTYFRRNPFTGVGCSELQEPKKALKTNLPLEYVKITYLVSENLNDRYKILHAGCHPGHNHVCQFL